MNISVISFTEKGRKLSEKLNKVLQTKMCLSLFCKSEKYKEESEHVSKCKMSLLEWTSHQFKQNRAIVFIGSCGIAVRAVAHCLKDKLTDVPVLVMDEAGQFVIPILSGHYGGANELAEIISEKLGAKAVITTATDINQLFAVDVFARENQLAICNKSAMKQISSALLAKEQVTIFIEGSYKGNIPEELTLLHKKAVMEKGSASIVISPYKERALLTVLQLCPKIFYVGIGCRRGKSFQELESAMLKHIKQSGICIDAVAGIASITLKAEEEGLCELAKRYKIPFHIFSAEELLDVPGVYTASSFVEELLGVENVCERAAMAACKKDGSLILKKQMEDGITIAIAAKKWSVTFL